MSTLFASGVLQVPISQVQNQYQPWYKKLLQHHQNAGWSFTSCSPSSPQQLQLQLQEKYRLLIEKQKNSRQDWWTKWGPSPQTATRCDSLHLFSNDSDDSWVKPPQQLYVPVGTMNQTFWSPQLHQQQQQQQRQNISLSSQANDVLHPYQQIAEGLRAWESLGTRCYDKELNLEKMREQEAIDKAAQAVRLQRELEQLLQLKERVKSRLVEMSQAHDHQAAQKQMQEALLAKGHGQNLYHAAFASPYNVEGSRRSPTYCQHSPIYRHGQDTGARTNSESFRSGSESFREQLLQQYEQILRQNTSLDLDCRRKELHLRPSTYPKETTIHYHSAGGQGRKDAQERAVHYTMPKQDMTQQFPWRNKDKIRPLRKSTVKPQHSSPREGRSSSISEFVEFNATDSEPRPWTDRDKMADPDGEERKDSECFLQSNTVGHPQADEHTDGKDIASQIKWDTEKSSAKSEQPDFLQNGYEVENKCLAGEQSSGLNENLIQGKSVSIEQDGSKQDNLEHVLSLLRKGKREDVRAEADSIQSDTTRSKQDSFTETSDLKQCPSSQESSERTPDDRQNKRRSSKKQKEKASGTTHNGHVETQTRAQEDVRATDPKEQRSRNKYNSRRQQRTAAASRHSLDDRQQHDAAADDATAALQPFERKMTNTQAHRQQERTQPYPRRREPRNRSEGQEDLEGRAQPPRRRWGLMKGQQRYFRSSARGRESRAESWGKPQVRRCNQHALRSSQHRRNAENLSVEEEEDAKASKGEEMEKTTTEGEDIFVSPVHLQEEQFETQQQQMVSSKLNQQEDVQQQQQETTTAKRSEVSETEEGRISAENSARLVSIEHEVIGYDVTSEVLTTEKIENEEAGDVEDEYIGGTLDENLNPASVRRQDGTSDSTGCIAMDDNIRDKKSEPECTSASNLVPSENSQQDGEYISDSELMKTAPVASAVPDNELEAASQITEIARDSCARMLDAAAPEDMGTHGGSWRADERERTAENGSPSSGEMLAPLPPPTAQHKVESFFVKQIVFEFHPRDATENETCLLPSGQTSGQYQVRT
ncbi:uncharacterized protein LOC112570292 [Pomacea canaliculata]|uniref:uncharacterized protein LOC112570292 n=1 Tax=Pomacea canaliculata TaxID=400727 RepID=UPI000D7356EB|nr:uncharacterized protein LOC112570292 [Pomacea canaliculata]